MQNPWDYKNIVKPNAMESTTADAFWAKEVNRVIGLLPFMGLPDASHNVALGRDYVYFNLPIGKGKYLFGVSCFQQIETDKLTFKDSEITRTHVQKAVCVVSQVPFFGTIHTQLEACTRRYFEQLDFRNTEGIVSLYTDLNETILSNLIYSNLFTRIDEVATSMITSKTVKLKQIVMLFKALMLEKKIVIFSSSVAESSSFVLFLVSLIPSLSLFTFNAEWGEGDREDVPYTPSMKCDFNKQKKYGLPLPLFHNDCQVYLHVPMQMLDHLGRPSGFLMGVCNSVMLTFPFFHDAVIMNLDTGKLDMREGDLKDVNLTESDQSKFCKSLRHWFRDFQKGLQPEEKDSMTLDSIINQVKHHYMPDKTSKARSPHTPKKKQSPLMTTPVYMPSPTAMPLNDRAESHSDGDADDDESDADQYPQGAAVLHPIRDKFHEYVESMLKLAAFAAGPNRSIDQLMQSVEKKGYGMRDFGATFVHCWMDCINFKIWLATHDLPAMPRYSSTIPRDGWAELLSSTGDIYGGQFKKGLRHGKGVFVGMSTGTRYQGSWNANMRHGVGTLTCTDEGLSYTGGWSNDSMSGHGSLTAPGYRYVGNFKNGQFDGEGQYRASDGCTYSGGFSRGFFSGYGQLITKDGEIFTGEWRLGQLEGFGTRGYEDGRQYTGAFKSSVPHGFGKMVYPDGSMFEGPWINGMRHGEGSFAVVLTSSAERDVYRPPPTSPQSVPSSPKSPQYLSPGGRRQGGLNHTRCSSGGGWRRSDPPPPPHGSRRHSAFPVEGSGGGGSSPSYRWGGVANQRLSMSMGGSTDFDRVALDSVSLDGIGKLSVNGVWKQDRPDQSVPWTFSFPNGLVYTGLVRFEVDLSPISSPIFVRVVPVMDEFQDLISPVNRGASTPAVLQCVRDKKPDANARLLKCFQEVPKHRYLV
eukprot:GHVO01014433.1.p1 GENE.GHVO01014433.1~~GHVO01014433.1.p1  ORF type:complete len:918 (+),score=164.85 GHVO01014433.1:413-3166(+)